MPRLNAKTMAEMIALPSHAQFPILHAQKYPKQGPAQYRRPYYAPTIDAIRNAYQSSDPHQSLQAATARIHGIGLQSRRNNLIRALDAFLKSDQPARPLSIQRRPRIEASIGEVALRASPDIIALDHKGRSKLLYYHCKAIPYDAEAAKRLLEIAHWLCEENEIDISPADIEMIDLTTGVIHRVRSRRARTITQMKQTAKVVESIWSDL